MTFKTNPILRTDSYKMSHFKQYPPGTKYVSSYIESRGGEWDKTIFFGLQIFIKDNLENPITKENIDQAQKMAEAHGVPFNREGWEYILTRHNGFLPLRIESVPEGTLVNGKNVLVQVVNTDPNCFWLTSYIETPLLRAIWYATTVATLSFEAKRRIFKGLLKSSDNPEEEIPFKLHDFGARGASSSETAGIGGLAHLVNFKGTDTIEALEAATYYYNEPCAGFSIPAAEHSTITSWGRSREFEAYDNMLNQFAKPGELVAVVSDSYDLWNTVTNIWGDDLLEKIKNSGATVVVRPDSGDPVETPIKVIEMLMDRVGFVRNKKGYKVLPPYFRVIQGDGMTLETITKLIDRMLEQNLSISNIAFGMGGGLLQKVDRDTLKFAMKQSAIAFLENPSDEEWFDVYKDPITDKGKSSKKGRLALMKIADEEYFTVREDFLKKAKPVMKNALQKVYSKSLTDAEPIIKEFDDFNTVRERANEPFILNRDEIYAISHQK